MPYRPAATALYTGDNSATAQGIASHLFAAPNVTDATSLEAATALFESGLKKVCTLAQPWSSVINIGGCDFLMKSRDLWKRGILISALLNAFAGPSHAECGCPVAAWLYPGHFQRPPDALLLGFSIYRKPGERCTSVSGTTVLLVSWWRMASTDTRGWSSRLSTTWSLRAAAPHPMRPPTF